MSYFKLEQSHSSASESEPPKHHVNHLSPMAV